MAGKETHSPLGKAGCRELSWRVQDNLLEVPGSMEKPYVKGALEKNGEEDRQETPECVIIRGASSSLPMRRWHAIAFRNKDRARDVSLEIIGRLHELLDAVMDCW
jgi:hypothetical protein